MKGAEVISRAVDEVTRSHDPTAHAEIGAVRGACAALGALQLDGCFVYWRCEPCPMCLGALFWARPLAVFHAATRVDAAAVGFDDAFIWEQFATDPVDRRLPMRQSRAISPRVPQARHNHRTRSAGEELMGTRMDNARSLYLEGIRDGRAEQAITKYSGERYVQHSHPVRDGKQGFIDFFADFHRRFADREIEILRAFEDGQYVFLHVTQSLNGGAAKWITADIFDTDELGRLIEHWDIIDAWVDDTVSGHSQVDGPTKPTDLDKTEENKSLVRAFVVDVLKDGHVERASNFISAEEYVQHSPQIGDGLGAFLASLRQSAEAGQPMVYDEVHKVVGSGDLVAVLSGVRLGSSPYAVIDLFRVAGGRIVEHWDAWEQIVPRDQWVNSGKF